MTTPVFLLVLLAALCHAAWNFAARRVSGDFAVMWLGMVSAAVCLTPFALYLALHSGPAVLPSMLGWGCVAATGVIHAIYFILLGRAYEQGEISVVYPVARGSGIGITATLGWSVLGEPVGFLGAGGIALVSAGILTMGWPRQRSRQGLGLALAVGATIPVYSIVDKVGANQAHPVFYLWTLYVIAAALTAPRAVRRHGPSLRHSYAVLLRPALVVGLGSMGTYLIILFAFRLGPVSYIVAARELSVVVGAALGVLFLGERLTASRAAAIAAIAVGLVALRLG